MHVLFQMQLHITHLVQQMDNNKKMEDAIWSLFLLFPFVNMDAFLSAYMSTMSTLQNRE